MPGSFFSEYPVYGVPIYTNLAAFPASAATGSLGIAADTGNLYEFNGTSWQLIGGPGSAQSLGNFDSQAPTAKGAALVGGVLSMQSADATHPGEVNTTTQTFAGAKTFSTSISSPSALFTGGTSGTLTLQTAPVTVDYTLKLPAGIGSGSQFLQMDGGGTGQLVWGNGTGSSGVSSVGTVNGQAKSADGLVITGTTIYAQTADASFPGLASTGAQTFAGAKTFSTAPILSSLTASLPLQLDGSKNIVSTAINLSGSQATGTLAAGRFPALTGDVTTSAGALATSLVATTNGTLTTLSALSLPYSQITGVPAAITALTGDGTASGPGSSALTLATVNSNIGTFASVTVNGKGLVTAAAALTGDVTTSSAAATVAKIQGTAVSGTTGTTNVVFSSAPTMSNPVVGTQSQGDASTKAASTAYVDTAVANAIAGINPAVAVQAATTAAGDTSSLTYNNGASGIGATFTGSNNTAITIDGFTFTALGQRLLVKNDTQSPSGAFNGVYSVTQLQASLTPPILTRALDYDTPTDINNTGAIPVVNGTVNGTTQWLNTAQVVTVGTTPLVYVKFSSNPSTVMTNPMTTTGDIIYSSDNSGTPHRLGIGSSSQVLGVSGGIPAWTTPSSSFKVPTVQAFTATGPQTGWLFTISTSSTLAIGDTYTNNGHTYTVEYPLAAQSGQVLFMTGTGATSGTTLTRSAGSGTASITFSAKVATAQYTIPSSPAPLYIHVIASGGGGGGGQFSTVGAAATAGGPTYFDGLGMVAIGGGAGANSGSGNAGGQGGSSSTATANTYLGLITQVLAVSGGSGQGNFLTASSAQGGQGGSNPLGGSGGGGNGQSGGSNGQSGVAGTGGGGGGAGSAAAPTGSGGGSGGYAEAFISSLGAGGTTLTYVVGAGGSGATGTTNGGAGGSGTIIVKEYYQ